MSDLEKAVRQFCMLAVVISLTAASALSQQQRPRVRIAMVIDGPWEQNDEIRHRTETEITSLLQREYDVQFSADKRIVADWTAPAVKQALDRLLADDEVDCVIALGVIASNEVARRGPLPKPVVAPYVLDPAVLGIPYDTRERRVEGRPIPESYHVSGVENLSYIRVDRNMRREVSRFLEVVPFKKLTMLALDALFEAIPEAGANLRRELGPLNLDVTVVRVGVDLDRALAEIPADTEAVYVGPLLQLSRTDFDRLVKALIDRKLPSFSLWGRREVERGLLAGLALERDWDRITRRIALNLQRILRGERAAELPVDFDHQERLSINMSTGRAIGVWPNWALMTEAELLNPVRQTAGRSLSLSKIVREASQVNLDLAASDRTVTAGLQLVREARANLLPQVDVSSQATFIDKDRAEASFGQQGQRQISGSLGVSQLLYSESARANYDVERSLQNLREEERAQLRLDVILEAAQGYLNVLRAKTAERIQRENLAVTRSNLELAISRRDIGYSGPGEVFRWESQIATNRREVIEANAQRNQTEIEVNRILNKPLEEPFETEESALDDPEFVVSFERLQAYLDNQESFRIFRRFMTAEAFEGSPELRQLNASVAAQERALLAARRAFHVPTVAVQADVTGYKNGGAGSGGPVVPPEFQNLIPGSPNALNWSVGVGVSLPLFQGGALRARRSRAEIELDELVVRREAARQRVEQRVRSVLHQAQASFAGIQLSREAARAAQENLDLVTDSYSEGLVDIVRLLDAQNQALVAELVAANAVYDFLIDLMSVQRAAGRFDYYRSGEDRQVFLERLDQFYREEGYVPRIR